MAALSDEGWLHTCMAVFCQMLVAIFFFFLKNGTVSFIKLYLTHFAWNSVSPFDSPRIRGVCYQAVFYCTFLLIDPFVDYSSSLLPGLVLCLAHSATFLSLFPHLHSFSLQFQRDFQLVSYFNASISYKTNTVITNFSFYCVFSFFSFFTCLLSLSLQLRSFPPPFCHSFSATSLPYFWCLNKNII